MSDASRTVAIVGADFPPSTMPSSLRLRFVVPHLRQFGWDPVVITIDPSHYETITDPDMVTLLPAGIEVLRTGALPVDLTRRAGLGDLGLRTLVHHRHALWRLCLSRRIDLVFISVPPYFSALLGRLAWERFKIPYVVDYQDPWYTTYYRGIDHASRPGGRKWAVMNAAAGILEPLVLRRAGHITAVSRGTIDEVVGRYPWLCCPTSEVPLGVEPEDLDFVLAHPRPNPIFDPGDGLFHVSYLGRVGVYMRETLRALFDAAALGLGAHTALFRRLRLHFVGTSYSGEIEKSASVLRIALEAGVEGLVDEHPARISYLDSLQVMCDSHAVLAIGSELPHYTASKIFPLLLAGRPIIAIFREESTVNDILRSAGADPAITFGPGRPPGGRVPAIAERLRHVLESPASPIKPNRRAVRDFTGEVMAGRLAGVFDQVLSQHARTR